MSDKRSSHSVVIAALWMMGALVSFMAMAIGGRELSAELSTFQILFFRSLIGLLVITLLGGRSRGRHLVTRHIGVHMLRNGAHFVGQFGWFYGLAFIPLSDVFAVEFTTPIWTALWAAVLLRERLTRPRIVAIGFGVVGLLIILRPGLQSVHPAALAVLIGAVGYALSHTLTKKLAHVDHPLTILWYMTLIQLPLGLIPSLFQWVTPSYALWPWLLVVGLSALSAHYCMTRAFALADATVVVPLDFLRLPLIAVVGFLFYQESLNWGVLLGAAIMLLGNWINISAEQARRKGLSAEQPELTARPQ